MNTGVKITDLDLDFVKNYLRIDHDEDDNLLSLMIVSAKNFIQSYLNIKFSEMEEIPDEFTIAALALIAHWYENREIQTNIQGELKYIFSGILDIYRNWNANSGLDDSSQL